MNKKRRIQVQRKMNEIKGFIQFQICVACSLQNPFMHKNMNTMHICVYDTES